jgi:hypothetical protein
MIALALALAGTALADTITLDTGAAIEGDLARYELGGDCQISVTEGALQGVIVIVPCHRVRAFVRLDSVPPAPLAPMEPEGVVVAVIDPPVALESEEESDAGREGEFDADIEPDSENDAGAEIAAPIAPTVRTLPARPISF